MNSLVAKISNAEVVVLRVLWANAEPLSMADIREQLSKSSEWDASTMKTLIRRLCEKGVIVQEKRDVFYFRALVSEQHYNDYMTQSLIDRLFGGSAKNLVASLLGNKKLAPEDVEDLRAMFKVGDDHE